MFKQLSFGYLGMMQTDHSYMMHTSLTAKQEMIKLGFYMQSVHTIMHA